MEVALHRHHAVGPRHWRLAEGLIDGIQGVAMGIKHRIEGLGEVRPQVHAIGDLDRVGGPLPGPVCSSSGPIPSDHADAGMRLAPEGHGLGVTIRQEGERSPPFEIDQHGPIGLALAIRPIVDAEHLGCAHIGEGQTAPQAQEGVATDSQAQGTAQPYPRPAPQRHRAVHQPGHEPRRPPRPGGDER